MGCNIIDVSEYKCVWRSQAPVLPHLQSSPGFHPLSNSSPSNATPSLKSWRYEEVTGGRQACDSRCQKVGLQDDWLVANDIGTMPL